MANESREEVVAISNPIADQWGIPRLLLLACGIAESNLRWNARRPTNPARDMQFWPDVSGGVWQQTVLYDPEYAGGSGYPGPGETERILHKQYDVTRAAHVAAGNLKGKWNGQSDDASLLAAMYQYNWPGGKGKPYTPEHAANYQRGLAEAKTILGEPMPAVTYNQSAPPIAQDDSWSCAPTSLRWALTSLGRAPGPTYIEDLLVRDGVVSKEQGLLDASGAQLAAWIGKKGPEYYGDLGFYGNNEPSVTFDGVAQEGTGPGVNGHAYPLLLGGRAWNHWTGVVGYNPVTDLLLLANPSDGWMNVGQTMSRGDWSRLGPWSMVRVLHPDLLKVFEAAPPPAPMPVPVPVPLDRAALAEKIKAIMALMDAQNKAIRSEWESLLKMVESAA